MAAQSLTCDVAIIGSGPAGASAARVAAAAGLKTLILEKSQIPRYKTCGGGILARAVRMLGESSIPVAERVCHVAEFGLSSDLRFISRQREPIVVMTMRDTFDEWLAGKATDAGAEVRCGWSIQDVSADENYVSLRSNAGSARARYLIIADGANGQSAKRAGWPDHRRLVPALECEVSVSGPDFARFASSARFDFHAVPHGYGWVFPKKSHLSIGVLTLNSAVANLNRSFDQYMTLLGINAPLSIQRHGYIIPIGPRDKTFARGRILVTGDAAGFADPVTAEGISNAILSGQLAAHSVVSMFPNPNQVAKSYNAAVEQHILTELQWARRLATLLYNSPLIRDRLFRWQGEKLASAMMEIVSGQATYVQLLTDFRNYLRLLSPTRQILREA